MKKLIAILLAVAMMASLAMVATAAENTMVLKVTVPAASYTITIPAVMEVDFGETSVQMAMPEVSECTGFEGKCLRLCVSDAVPITDGTNSVRMKLYADHAKAGGSHFNLRDFAMYYDVECERLSYTGWFTALDYEAYGIDCISINFEKDDWYKLAPGEWDGYIEFTSEVIPMSEVPPTETNAA